MIVKLVDAADKKIIFANKDKLRSVKNVEGRPIYINSQVPDIIN